MANKCCTSFSVLPPFHDELQILTSHSLQHRLGTNRVRVKVMLCLGVRHPSGPVCLGVRHPSGTRTQFFPLLSLIIFRQFRVCWCGAPSMMRRRSVVFRFCQASPAQFPMTHDHLLLSLFLRLPPPPNLEGQVPVFISQLYSTFWVLACTADYALSRVVQVATAVQSLDRSHAWPPPSLSLL
jgi:hypothetical protein